MFLLNLSMSMPLAVYARPLLQYWVSPLYAQEGSTALVIFVAAMAINASSLAVGFLSWAAGRAGVNLVFASLTSGISLAAIYPLASRYSVVGAATAGLLGALVAPFFIHYVNRRILEVSSVAVLRRCYLPTVVGAGVAALASSLILVPHAKTLASTVSFICASAILSLIISGALGGVSRDDLRGLEKAVVSLRGKAGI